RFDPLEVGPWNNTFGNQRFAGEQFDLQPDFEFVFVRPYGPHCWARIPLNHGLRVKGRGLSVEVAVEVRPFLASHQVRADKAVRARAPVRAYTQRGASPRQAERSPACNRSLLRRGDTRWGAAG